MKFNFNIDGVTYTNRTCSDDTTVSIKPVSFSVEYSEKETLAAYEMAVKIAEVIASAMTMQQTSSEDDDDDFEGGVTSWLNQEEIEDDIL